MDPRPYPQSEPYGGGAMSFQEDFRVFSLGCRSLMYFDSVILREATSLQRRNIRIRNDDAVGMVSGWCWRM